MTNLPLKLPAEYWSNFSIMQRDVDFIQNHLFEVETPLSTHQLALVLVQECLRIEAEDQLKQNLADGALYLPKETYTPGQRLIFPALGMRKGSVQSVRPGKNPDVAPFEVIQVQFEDGSTREFAASLEEHRLNHPVETSLDPETDLPSILARYGTDIEKKLDSALALDENLVRIADAWFPLALLLDINTGHLNLAEAILEMNSGEPLATQALMRQLDIPLDSNPQLTEFSVNYALQEDGRFDEVGPAGEVLWCLRRLEPEQVQNIPEALRYDLMEYDRSVLTEQMLSLEAELDDELSETERAPLSTTEATITLTYPHWRTGTLPVSQRISALFPTAMHSSRIRFTLIDARTGERIPAWVVRDYGYVYGLQKWYQKQKLIPGAYIHIRRTQNPGEVQIEARTHRANREWMRTVLAGSDGELVFALLKHEVSCDYDERMAFIVPDETTIDASFKQKSRQSFERIVREILQKLAGLTPQGHVHAEELYAAVNMLRRTPPAPLFALLASSPQFTHIGDLHYRIASGETEN